MEGWLNEYDLLMFDFDGLLADTEHVHHRAYTLMLKNRGYTLDWDFETYCSYVLTDATMVRHKVYEQFPELYNQEPDWTLLYEEKKKISLEILEEEPVPLLAGVERVIYYIRDNGKLDSSCVVTHSSKAVTDVIRRQNAVLNLIPNWITREDYNHPKPAPDAYAKAISLYCKPGGNAIGFEDSIRGVRSIIAAGARPVFVNATGKYGIDSDGNLQTILNQTTTFKTFHETFSQS